MSSMYALSCQPDRPCAACGFLLWEPIAVSGSSKLGLYNDDRFPGRCILELTEHRTSLEDVSMDSIMGFMRDIQIAMEAIREAVGAERVNVAILGNRDSHVHAHLIPRFPSTEAFPDCSPWNDPRVKGAMGRADVERHKRDIGAHLLRSETRSSTKVRPVSQGVILDI